jgi:hypothetical protein
MVRVFRSMAVQTGGGRRIVRVVVRGAIRMQVGCDGGAGLVRETRQLQGGSHPLQRQSQQQEASEDEAKATHGRDFTSLRSALCTLPLWEGQARAAGRIRSASTSIDFFSVGSTVTRTLLPSGLRFSVPGLRCARISRSQRSEIEEMNAIQARLGGKSRSG